MSKFNLVSVPESLPGQADLEQHENNRAVLSLSGGLDSTCLLLWLLAHKVTDVRAFSFYYGQRHKVELKKAKKNIKFLQDKGFNIDYKVIDLTDVFSDSASSLHPGNGNPDIPEGHYAADNMKSTVVENRNIIFSSILYGKALGWANKIGDNVFISLGLHSGDHAIYPDCRPESFEAAKHLFAISNWNSERVDYIAPFDNIDKAQVLAEGIQSMLTLGFTNAEIKKVLKNTNTCYNPSDTGEACGKCGSCTERLEAFEKNGLKDPVSYKQAVTQSQITD